MSEQTDPLAIVKAGKPELEALLQLHMPGKDVALLAQQEILYLEQVSFNNKEIATCLPETILYALKGVMRQNLTLDPEAGLVYVTTRSVNIGTKDQAIWKKALVIKPSANGKLSIELQRGNIIDFTRPVVQKDTSGKAVGVCWKILKPSHPEPRWEEIAFDESDFLKWRQYSHKDNSRTWKESSGKPSPDAKTLNYANPLYTSVNGGIDPEFARAKCIRHSLSKLGSNPNIKREIKVIRKDANIVDPNIDAQEEAEYIPYTDLSNANEL